MKYNKKADLITIGQWIENKICFGTFKAPFTSNQKYEEIGNKFIKYVIGFTEYNLLYNKPEFFDYKVHCTMKNLVSYRLTPYAIAFVYNYLCQEKENIPIIDDDDIRDNHYIKNIMYLSDKALCNFRITIKPWELRHINFHIRDYFEQYPNEEFAIEMDGIESTAAGEGENLVSEALYILQDVPVLLQAGFLHYGDYECDEGMERVEKLMKFYESLGFENVNNEIGNYKESVMMLAHKDKIKELKEEKWAAIEEERNLKMEER